MISALLFGTLLMSMSAWASNIWPGVENWFRAAISRLLWWALPIGMIAAHQGVETSHVYILGGAAWLGAWIPHVDEMPDIRTHWTTLLGDVGLAVLRSMTLLAPIAAVFWVCGAFWITMVWAAFSVVPAILAANMLPTGVLGFRNPRQIAGVLFGAATGLCIAAAIGIDVPTPDYLP